MIAGIGTDIVRVERIGRSLERLGEAFALRILAESELPEFHASKQKAHFLAKRFAVKEAASKAFGTGIGAELSFHDIAVAHDERGKPLLRFSEAAKARLGERGITDHHVSISDEHEYVIAFVVMESAA